jgi:chromosome condensin MukBEF ATPase and DNA-binding subunit MukB
MNLRERRKYMNDFAQLLVELSEAKKRIEAIERILPRMNELYFEKLKSEEHRESLPAASNDSIK